MSDAPSTRPLLLVMAALGAAVFLAHSSLHAGWLIDDAGISLAYSRTLAAGHGLTTQPGVPPVEGFSNPLWVLLCAALYRLGLMTLPVGLKLFSLLCTALAFVALHRSLRRIAPAHALAVSAGVLGFSALNPAVVLWCTAGLENPLYLCAVMLLLLTTLRADARPGPAPAALAGGVAAALAWTRPEGVLWGLLPPALVAGRLALEGGLEALRPRRGDLVAYLAAWLLPLLVGLCLRRWFFGAWAPNTYQVKGGPGAAEVAGILLLQPAMVEKSFQLTSRLFGSSLSHAVLLATGALGVHGIRTRRLGPRHAVLLAFALSASALFLLLPADWMAETRFATPAYPLLYACVLLVLAEGLGHLPAPGRDRSFAVVCLALAAATLPEAAFRAAQVAGRANIGIRYTARAHGERFNQAAEELGLTDASVMVPDLGGTLLESRLRVYDLGGLCDREVARTLGKDRPGLHEYVFEVARPTFLAVHGAWAEGAAFEQDPRFVRDYTPLYVYREGDEAHDPVHAAGVYVRREAVAGKPEVLRRLRARDHRLEAFAREPDRGPAWRWLLALPLPRPPPEKLVYPVARGAFRPYGGP